MKGYWLLVLLFAMLISFFITVGSGTFALFILFFIIVSTILLVFGQFILFLSNQITIIGVRITIFIMMNLALIVGVFFGYNALTEKPCEDVTTFAHYHSHVITGACNYGGYSECGERDPWYITEGCEKSPEVKLAIFSQTEWYGTVLATCRENCELGLEFKYCLPQIPDLPLEDISCQDILNCEGIPCT